MKPSKISWTDFSGGNLNFISGCTPISVGCENCYARSIYERFGRDHSVVTMHPEKLERLRTQTFREKTVWEPFDGGRYICTKPGEEVVWRSKNWGLRPMCFVCDTGDIFHEEVTDEFLMDAFMMMKNRTDVIWQVLTKRHERMRDFMRMFALGINPYRDAWPMENVWLGVTAENQEMADKRIPVLLDTWAATRFVSVEPMLGPVDLLEVLDYWNGESVPAVDGLKHHIDWVLCGGESGSKRREFDVDWALMLQRECYEHAIPFFYKQGGDLRPGANPILPEIGVVQEWPWGAGRI